MLLKQTVTPNVSFYDTNKALRCRVHKALAWRLQENQHTICWLSVSLFVTNSEKESERRVTQIGSHQWQRGVLIILEVSDKNEKIKSKILHPKTHKH